MLGGSTDEVPDLLTPFERWCERVGLRPEAWNAWPLYELAAAEHLAA